MTGLRSEPQEPATSGRVILVVDDEPEVRAILSQALVSGLQGVRVLVATDGAEALDVLSRESVDLILTDERMPRMSGSEFLRRIAHVNRAAPRILLTAFPDEHLAITALNSGHVSRFLTKPIRPSELVRTVLDLLRQRHAREQSVAPLAKAFADARAA